MAANFVSLLIFPDSNPLARGSLTMMATFFSLGVGKKRDDRLLAKNVENDLERSQLGLLETKQSFVHRFNARSETLDLSFFLTLAEPLENFASTHDFCWNAMELRQVERLDVEPAQGRFNGLPNPAFGIFVRVKVLHSAKLCRDEDRHGGFLLQKASYQALAAAISIDVGRVKECHARLNGSSEDSERLLVRNISPICAAELPAT